MEVWPGASSVEQPFASSACTLRSGCGVHLLYVLLLAADSSMGCSAVFGCCQSYSAMFMRFILAFLRLCGCVWWPGLAAGFEQTDL